MGLTTATAELMAWAILLKLVSHVQYSKLVINFCHSSAGSEQLGMAQINCVVGSP